MNSLEAALTVASVRHKALVVCPQRQMMVEVLPLLASTVPLVPLRKINNFLDKKDISEALAGFDARRDRADQHRNDDKHAHDRTALVAAKPPPCHARSAVNARGPSHHDCPLKINACPCGGTKCTQLNSYKYSLTIGN